jgi:hypothetical protein
MPPMKVQELDEPVGAGAEPPPHHDHRVVVPLDAVAPSWRRTHSGETAALPADPPMQRKDPP